MKGEDTENKQHDKLNKIETKLESEENFKKTTPECFREHHLFFFHSFICSVNIHESGP